MFALQESAGNKHLPFRDVWKTSILEASSCSLNGSKMYTLGVGSYLAGIISSTRSSLSRPDCVHVTNLCHHHSRKEEVRVCLLTAVQQFISAVQQHDRAATPMYVPVCCRQSSGKTNATVSINDPSRHMGMAFASCWCGPSLINVYIKQDFSSPATHMLGWLRVPIARLD